MYVFGRLLKTIVRGKLLPPVDPMAEVRTPLRIWPNDLDLYGHVNNGRYLTLADIGRFDTSVRSGLLKLCMRTGWKPVVGSAHVQFRRSLLAFQRFELRTQIVGWDDKWAYLSQRFYRNDVEYARVLVRIVFKDGRDTVPPSQVVDELGSDGTSPPLSDWIEALRQADRHKSASFD